MHSFRKQIYKMSNFADVEAPSQDDLIAYLTNEPFLEDINDFCSEFIEEIIYFDVAPNTNTVGTATAYTDEGGTVPFEGGGTGKYYILPRVISAPGQTLQPITITGGTYRVVEISSTGTLVGFTEHTVTSCNFPFTFNTSSFLVGAEDGVEPGTHTNFYLKLTDINTNGSIKTNTNAQIYTDSNLSVAYNPTSGGGNYGSPSSRIWVYCAEPSFSLPPFSKFYLQIDSDGTVQGYNSD